MVLLEYKRRITFVSSTRLGRVVLVLLFLCEDQTGIRTTLIWCFQVVLRDTATAIMETASFIRDIIQVWLAPFPETPSTMCTFISYNLFTLTEVQGTSFTGFLTGIADSTSFSFSLTSFVEVGTFSSSLHDDTEVWSERHTTPVVQNQLLHPGYPTNMACSFAQSVLPRCVLLSQIVLYFD